MESHAKQRPAFSALPFDSDREMQREHDPLALHISVSRRHYRNASDTKSGKRHHLFARHSWQQAFDLGFRETVQHQPVSLRAIGWDVLP
jgi:hypothetical protein